MRHVNQIKSQGLIQQSDAGGEFEPKNEKTRTINTKKKSGWIHRNDKQAA